MWVIRFEPSLLHQDKIMGKKDQTVINTVIANYMGGNYSDEEIALLTSWLEESKDNQKHFNEMKRVWEASETFPVSTEKALGKVMKRIESKNNGITLWGFWQKAAAILFIPLLLSVLYVAIHRGSKSSESGFSYKNVEAAFGSISTMELPDGSKVWLNAGSSLKYPEKFSKNERSVFLVGEAYFEVQSDPESPFVVNTSGFSVKATGTRFNVMAYQNSLIHSVTLAEGKVAVLNLNPAKKNGVVTVLLPNQHLTYNAQSGNSSIQTEEIYKHIAWKDGKLVFRNDLISEVARKISLQYNVDIEIQGDKILSYRFRATFENEPLNELLRLLKMSSPIDYREVSPQLLPDSTFTRRKIIIFSTEF